MPACLGMYFLKVRDSVRCEDRYPPVRIRRRNGVVSHPGAVLLLGEATDYQLRAIRDVSLSPGAILLSHPSNGG